MSIKNYIETLDKMFDVINESIYGGDLTSKPIFTIAESKKGETSKISADTVWVDKTSGEVFYEISISSEVFEKDIVDVFAIVLHECCHLFSKIYGYTDTKNDKGINHTEEFKDVAEQHGLDCGTKDKKYGYGLTILNEDGKKVFEENKSKFCKTNLYAKYPVEEKKEREPVTKYKYTCTNPDCPYNTKFTIKFQLNDAKCECDSELNVETIEPQPIEKTDAE